MGNVFKAHLEAAEGSSKENPDLKEIERMVKDEDLDNGETDDEKNTIKDDDDSFDATLESSCKRQCKQTFNQVRVLQRRTRNRKNRSYTSFCSPIPDRCSSH